MNQRQQPYSIPHDSEHRRRPRHGANEGSIRPSNAADNNNHDNNNRRRRRSNSITRNIERIARNYDEFQVKYKKPQRWRNLTLEKRHNIIERVTQKERRQLNLTVGDPACPRKSSTHYSRKVVRTTAESTTSVHRSSPVSRNRPTALRDVQPQVSNTVPGSAVQNNSRIQPDPGSTIDTATEHLESDIDEEAVTQPLENPTIKLESDSDNDTAIQPITPQSSPPPSPSTTAQSSHVQLSPAPSSLVGPAPAAQPLESPAITSTVPVSVPATQSTFIPVVNYAFPTQAQTMQPQPSPTVQPQHASTEQPQLFGGSTQPVPRHLPAAGQRQLPVDILQFWLGTTLQPPLTATTTTTATTPDCSWNDVTQPFTSGFNIGNGQLPIEQQQQQSQPITSLYTNYQLYREFVEFLEFKRFCGIMTHFQPQ